MTIAEAEERMTWREFAFWGRVFEIEDRELAKQKAELEQKERELASKKGSPRGGRGAGGEEVVLSKPKKKALHQPQQPPAFKPPGRGNR